MKIIIKNFNLFDDFLSKVLNIFYCYVILNLGGNMDKITKIYKDEPIGSLAIDIIQNFDKKEIKEIEEALRMYALTGGSTISDNMLGIIFLPDSSLTIKCIPEKHRKEVLFRLSSINLDGININPSENKDVNLNPKQISTIAKIRSYLEKFSIYDLYKIETDLNMAQKDIYELWGIIKNIIFDRPYEIVSKHEQRLQEHEQRLQECKKFIQNADLKTVKTLKYVLDVYCCETEGDGFQLDRKEILLIQHPEAAQFVEVSNVDEIGLDVALKLKKLSKDNYDLVFKYAKNQNNPFFDYISNLPPHYSGLPHDANKSTQTLLQKRESDQIISARKELQEFKKIVKDRLKEANKG